CSCRRSARTTAVRGVYENSRRVYSRGRERGRERFCTSKGGRTMNTKTKAPAVDMDDPILLKAAKDALLRCKTADDVRAVWKDHYLKIGHKRLGRLLMGFAPTRGKKNGE